MPKKPKTDQELLAAAGVKENPDGSFTIQDRFGRSIETDASTAVRYLKQGGGVESLTARAGRLRSAELEQQFGTPSEKVRTFGEGGLSTLSLGLSDLLFDDAGKRAEVNPGYRTAGELTGLVVGVAAGGGAGSVTKSLGGGLLGASGRLATRAGKGFEGLLGGGTAARIAGMGVEGAIDTGFLNAGQTLSHLALTNKPITGEALAGGFISGLAPGAAGGVIAGTALTGLEKLRSRRVAALFDDSARKALDDQWNLKIIDEVEPKTVIDTLKFEASSFSRHEKAYRKAGLGPEDFKSTSAGFKKAAKLDDLGEAAPSFAAEMSSARSALHKVAKTPDEFIKAVAKGDASSVNAIKAYDDYYKEVSRLGKNDPGLAASLEKNHEALIASVEKALDLPTGGLLDKAGTALSVVELADIVSGGQLIPDEQVLGPVGSTLLKAVALGKLYKDLGGGSGGGGLFSRAVKGVAGRGAEVGIRRRLFGAGVRPEVAAGAGVAANMVARKGLAKAIDGDLSGLVRTQLRSEGRISRAIKKFGTSPRAMAYTGLEASKALSGLMTEGEQEQIKKEKDPAKKFLKTQAMLKKLMVDPNESLRRAHELTADLRALDPELGEMVKAKMLETLDFLNQKAPVNPGTMRGLTGDLWVPSPAEMDKWSRYAQAALDPASTVELAAAGRMTPEAAEALKRIHPAHFAQMQKELMSQPEIVAKMPYSQRIHLGLIYEVPVDPMLTILPQLQDDFALMESSQIPQGSPPQSSSNNTPTKAQQLTER